MVTPFLYPNPRWIDTIAPMDSLDSRLTDLVEELTLAGDWTDRYRLLVEWGEELQPLAEADRTPNWEVPGCSSPLWLKVEWKEGLLAVQGATPGVLPKALVAVVVRLFSGLPQVSGSVSVLVDALGFRRHLSPTRLFVLEEMLHRALSCPRSPR